MNRGTTILFCSCFAVASVLLSAHEQSNDPKQSSVLSALKKGQTVMLTDVVGRHEITILKGVQAGHRVLEVQNDFLVLEDASGITQIVIPIHAINSIKTIKLVAKSP
jgi:hypothetical protein